MNSPSINAPHSLTRLAFRYRPVTYLLSCLLLGLGLFALLTLPRREDPDLKGRFAQVIALYPGASAPQVEELVSEKLERTLREVDDIQTVTATSRAGVAVLQIEAADRMTGTLDKLMDDLRERIADVRPSLPSGVVSVSVNDRFSDTAALIIAVSRPGASPRQLEELAKAVRDRLRLLPEAAEVRLIGEQEGRINVSVSSRRLAALGGAVTLDAVSQAVARRNVLPETAGSLPSGASRIGLMPSGEVKTPSEMENLVVGTSVTGAGASRLSAPIYLRDVARVTSDYADPPGFLLRTNSRPSVAVTLTMRKGGNISLLGQKVTAALAELTPSLPPGTEITTVNDLPRSVAARVSGFFHELQWAVAIICGVMFLFMGWRSAALVGILLPVSMLGTLAAMWLAGRDIQQMSIAALIIALALVVDNSIVVLDNIEEKLSEAGSNWRDPKVREEAAIRGTDELRGPLVTANLVAVSSFLPLAFLPGGVGDFVRDLGLVTSLSLVVSVLINLTIMPFLCYHFLIPIHAARQNFVQAGLERIVDSLRDGKATLAQRAFERPGLVVGLAALALVASVSLIPRLGAAFFPSAERDQFVVDVWLPEGRDITATALAAARVEKIIQKQGGVRSFVTYIGQGGPRFYYNVNPEAPTPNYAQIVVNTSDVQITERLVRQVQTEANRTIAEARVTAKKLEQGPPVGAPVAVRISGPNVAELRRVAADVRALLNQTPGTFSVYDNFGELPLRLRVNVDEDRAARVGLSSEQVAQTARLAFTGQTVSYLRDGDRETPIVLRLDSSERRGASDVAGLYLPTPTGATPLSDIASLQWAAGDGRIVRRNAERTVTVYAYPDGSRLPSAIVADVQKTLAARPLLPGYKIGYGGESEEAGKSFQNMIVVFSAAIVFNLVVLVIQFNSFPVVVAVLSAVPLGVIGAIPGLYVANQNFGFMAFLGIAALGGIVTNHTIFIFHYAQEEAHQHHLPMTDALVRASRRRLRPILLTVLLSIGALLPQALSGSKLFPPLDWAIIAGLLVSTFLTMIVVPSVFALLAGKRARAWDVGEEAQGKRPDAKDRAVVA